AISRCIQAASQYAIELNSRDAKELRANLERLAARTEHLEIPKDYELLAADFRGELRLYRDQFQAGVDQLRAEVAQAIETMQGMLTTVTESGGDHERTLREEFHVLET